MNSHYKACFKIFYLFILLAFLISCSQNTNKQDSKSNNIAESEYNTQQADSLYTLGKSYSEDSINQEKALDLYWKSFKIYEQLDNKHKMAILYKRIGFAYDYMEDHSNEIKYLKKALIINTEIDNKKQSAIILNFLGIAYTITGDIDSALMFYNQGIELTKITRDTIEFIELYQNIGISYQYAGNYEKAIESHIKALKYCEKTNYIKGIFSMSINIAQNYKDYNELEMALNYIEKADVLINSISNPYTKASFYDTYASIYFKKSNYVKANTYYNKCLKISRNVNFKRGVACAYSNLALVALEEKNFEEAEKLAQLSIDIEIELNNVSGIILSLSTIAGKNMLY